MPNEYPPILVTGSHRSGTTWIGNMLTAAGTHTYIVEPLNVHHRGRVLGTPAPYWYMYISEENETEFLPAFHNMLKLKYPYRHAIKVMQSPRDIGRLAQGLWRFESGRLQKRSALFKDPFALLSSRWFAERLGCQVVISIRHPAAFASSLKRLKWRFRFNDLLDQAPLMHEWLEPYRAEMAAIQPGADVLEQASLLWKILYGVVRQFQQDGQPFQFVRHEDLSLDPVAAYRQLYQTLGLPFTEKAEAAIRAASSPDNPTEVAKDDAFNFSLDSRANLKNWKKRLTAEEVVKIRKLTEEVAAHFYTDEDWN